VERLPLFEGKISKKIAEQRLRAVSEAVNLQIAREPEPGFLTGLAGQALFLYTYGRYTGSSRCENGGFLALERALAMINNGFSWPSFAAGLAGIRFTLRYLAARGYISEADGRALDDVRPYLYEFAEKRFAAGDYDFLHGALGMYIGSDRYMAHDDVIEKIGAMAVPQGEGMVAWESKHPQTGENEINLGLAHGVPSVLWSLSQLDADPLRDRLLEQGVSFMLAQRQENAPNGSGFPHRIVNGRPDQQGRLAWCYGDPGVGAALWQVGQRCNRPDWQADAIGILHKAASRRKAEENRVFDACVCHGTAGLALLFYKMAILTGHEELLGAAAHWAGATLDHGAATDGAAGYRFLTTGNRWVENYGLLEGITGVGLALLALLDAETMGWEQGMML
jgi:lantibiotic modifying enzyme